MRPFLIFDYDGTLHNTLKIYEPAFRAAFRWLVEEGYEHEQTIPSGQLASWLGLNSRDMWEAFRPMLPQKVKEKASAMIGKAMVQNVRGHMAQWYQGAEALLDALKSEGCQMVVLSNCKRAYREAHWEEFSMERWFTDFYDCESFDFAPKTIIVQTIMQRFSGPYIVIGDRKNDLECARACRGRFLGCLYGYGTEKELYGADFLADRPRDILTGIHRLSE